MRGIVRACVDAARFFQMSAEIAGSGFLLEDRLFAARIFLIVDANCKGMEIDIAVGAVARTEAAANAPVLDDDLERISATNGTDRAAHHAERIAALTARGGDQKILKSETVADETGYAVVGVGAGVHAGVATRAFLEIEDEQALRFHQALREELIDGNGLDQLEALGVGELTLGDNGFEADTDVRKTPHHFAEVFAGDFDDFDVIEGGTGGRTDATAEQTDFAEVVAAGQVGENEFAARIIFGDLHEPDAHEVEGIGRLPLTRDDLARSVADKFHAVFEAIDKVGGEFREHGDAAKMRFEGAAAVVFVDLRAKGFVFHHDVEDVAQHFKRDDIGFGTDGGRAGIEIHAGHFAKEVAGTELRDGIAVGEIDGRIDRDGAVAVFLVALILFAADQNARETLEEALGAALGLDMSDGCGDGDLCVAFGDVEGGGAEIAFAADHFAGPETALDNGTAVEFEKGAGDAGENWHAVELLRGERLTAFVGCDRGADDSFVGERAGRATDHAFAAGDTSGIAHRRVEIEGDAGGIPFAHAAKDEIVFDFVAAADAAIAKDAGVTIDGNGQRRFVGATRGVATEEPWSGDAGLSGEGFEFAIGGALLAGAGGGMVGHQEFEKSFARGEDFFGAGADLHARFDWTHAGSAEHTRARVHDAKTADADGGLALKMAESRDGDAVDAGGVEHSSAGGNLDGFAVDGELNELGRAAHLGANSCAREFRHLCGGGKTDAARTPAVKNVGIDFVAEMFQHGLDGRGNDLA